ncbi:MAG: MFS transporter [Actinomycetia bacterium]|nr:MFS transporter [Actinomycetes bacterium]
MPGLIQRLRQAEHLLVLSGATFLVMVGQGVVAPVLPLYAREFGVEATMVGLTLTVFALARLILNIPAGLVADRHGRRLLLVGGPLITSVGMIGSGLANDIWTLLVWRFVAGAGSGFYMSAAMIYLIDIAPPDKRARYVATNQWALSFGVAVGPGVGGLIAERYGLDMPFFVVGGTALLTAIYAAVRLPETRPGQPPEPTDGSPPPAEITTWALLSSKQFLLIAVVTATIFMSRAGTRGTLVPLHANDVFEWGAGELGLLFTATGMLTLFTLIPAAGAADRVGRAWVILFSGIAAGAGTLVIGGSSTVTAFVVGNVVMSLGTGTAGPAPAAYVADIAPPNRRGMAVALYRSAGDFGFVAAPPLLGLLSEATSIGVAMRVSAALVAGAAVLFLAGSRGDPAAGRQA